MRETAAKRLKEAMKPGRVYRSHELASYSNNLNRDLSKLVASEEIVMAAQGLYYRPKSSRFGAVPATDEELVRAFLNDGDFLITSMNHYNGLGLRLTQLYNQTLVYNRKRHGDFKLDKRTYSFRRPRNFPEKLSMEFLYVDALNNKKLLAEDTTQFEPLLLKQIKEVDGEALLSAAQKYGKVYTRKFFEEALNG